MSEEDGSDGQKKDDERPSERPKRSDLPPGSPAAARPPRPRSITLKFEGPGTLKLPDELDEIEPQPKTRTSSEPRLRLDTGEFHAVEPPDDSRKFQLAADALAEWTRSSAPPAPPATTPSGSLDLDLDDLEPPESAVPEDAPPTRGTVEYSPAMAKKFP